MSINISEYTQVFPPHEGDAWAENTVLEVSTYVYDVEADEYGQTALEKVAAAAMESIVSTVASVRAQAMTTAGAAIEAAFLDLIDVPMDGDVMGDLDPQWGQVVVDDDDWQPMVTCTYKHRQLPLDHSLFYSRSPVFTVTVYWEGALHVLQVRPWGFTDGVEWRLDLPSPRFHSESFDPQPFVFEGSLEGAF